MEMLVFLPGVYCSRGICIIPPSPPLLFSGVLEDNLAKNCTAFVMQAGDVMVDHCRMDVLYVCSCVCFARVLSFPDFVDLENIMVFILLCDTRCIFRFMWCPFSRVSWLFSSTVSFYLYTFERASGDSCSREQLS